MSDKMKQCKACGTELYKGAKVCPKCGKKQGGKGKFILIAVIVIILIGAFAGGGDDESSQTADTKTEQEITYTQYSLADMFKELESNAMVAEEDYTDAYVEVSGRISVIDSDGSYISIEPNDGGFYLIGMTCYFQNDDQKAVIREKSVGDIVTVKGQIYSVGEVMGYDLEIDSIE